MCSVVFFFSTILVTLGEYNSSILVLQTVVTVAGWSFSYNVKCKWQQFANSRMSKMRRDKKWNGKLGKCDHRLTSGPQVHFAICKCKHKSCSMLNHRSHAYFSFKTKLLIEKSRSYVRSMVAGSFRKMIHETRYAIFLFDFYTLNRRFSAH